jgi:hypothetical protein
MALFLIPQDAIPALAEGSLLKKIMRERRARYEKYRSAVVSGASIHVTGSRARG